MTHGAHSALPAVLSIAGSDSSGGAGIQADLKTMLMCGVFGMSAITSLTAQNTTGVRMVEDVTPEMLAAQIDAVFEDIRPDAVKIGMVSSVALIEVIEDRLRHWQASNVVLDPVMIATSGAKLISDDAVDALTSRLFPLATVITPNIPEAETLTVAHIANAEDMETAGARLAERFGCSALIKGGHNVTGDADDVLVDANGTITWFPGTRLDNPNTHGTGCTLSSAIASGLAKGDPLPKAIKRAKKYLTGAIKANLDLGHGSGPLDHAWKLRK
ncbi:bifunctional hydroxymethylpyrimidine kinase/phosphomethylpyrimidine kinase [Bifidobacterium vespertilionis]|uniref:bifunctional hydroxymethylpyrimidine kinase/phosphomethylpyrimidine kinase n=1 Tax=Bifidobacterium vespertilionis TaxID=2562524 RepID=UPI001BDD5FF0|nr:bifunctional hydroxymethylpyrimidine kinase/phosphomethylpyrimidine kinase [Bifidobacterium vespertilionis]MBT1180054.1 bifunctional hydroxymethylpyrimidine kinase/phosphomethylpyrimidine kinase [Bifidobacterium vespertilionis]